MDIERTNAVSLKVFIQGCKALGYEDELEAFLVHSELVPVSISPTRHDPMT